MATPQSISSQGSSKFRKYEQIVSQFCPECSNQLYPKEDVQRRKLLYVCRTCQYAEEAKSYCVYRNILNNSAAETAGVTQDVGSDPTVSRISPAISFFLPFFPSPFLSFHSARTCFASPCFELHWLTNTTCLLFFERLQLPRTQKACPKCHHEWAVFFQSQERSAETGMASTPCTLRFSDSAGGRLDASTEPANFRWATRNSSTSVADAVTSLSRDRRRSAIHIFQN